MALQEPSWVEVRANTYSIYVGHHILADIKRFEPYVSHKSVFIVSDLNVQHNLATLSNTCLQAKATRVNSFLISSAEQYKTLDLANKIWSSLLSQYYYRDSIMIALGGGMIGDLAGFCASCYMRGMGFIQCPTTLLAQIDAAIGGKTAVNFNHNKNMIGTFYPPMLVLSDIQTLESLPQREFIAGLAELIKYGISLDADFFEWIENHIESLLLREKAALSYAIVRASQLKVEIVAQDEKDLSLRKVLNFGHTVAHALESLLDYQGLLHGEAVAIGMVVATRISVMHHRLDRNTLARLIKLLIKVGLPVEIPQQIAAVAILSKIKHDKKHQGNKLQWVLLTAIGKAKLDDAITFEQISNALTEEKV
ncbi:MAG: 3-dehydroquinate synthase [Proteobacteria bacterium]|nr:3-dehydroquinate synthase [Pseudomonadota bacterium]